METATVVTGEARIRVVAMIAQKHALALECKGMKRRGRSMYSIIKLQHGLKGNKHKVLEQFTALVEQAKKGAQ